LAEVPGTRSSPRAILSRAFDRFAGSALVEAVSRRATSNHLRILAYHGVDDPETFSSQMAHVRSHYTPVSVDQVLGSLEGVPLPALSVWVTFDDGHPNVIEDGLPVVEKYEIPVTMFVCPGVINSSTPLWWQSVEWCLSQEIQPELLSPPDGRWSVDELVRTLKQLPDERRRRIVGSMVEAASRGASVPPSRPQLNNADLQRLERAGGTIGNHTWDHPTLDTCEPVEQERQIRLAHTFLETWPGLFRPVIAYPNGNWTDIAESLARQLGYRIGLLFDHWLADVSRPPLSWSRLRVNSDTSMSRFRAIMTGTHPGLTRVRSRMSRGLPTETEPSPEAGEPSASTSSPGKQRGRDSDPSQSP
jgi:peptidoglycan/xylan/chitin deacetylase (PgdA/CDA1 family)